MKRNCLFLLTLTLLVLSLNSCLSGSNQTSGTKYGVYREYGTTYYHPVLKCIDGDWVYSTSMESKMTDGKCYFIAFEFDGDDAQNSSAMIQSNGYLTITMTNCVEIDTHESLAYYGTPDTARAKPYEILLNTGYQQGSYAYVDGMLMLQCSLYEPSDRTVKWELQYDYSGQYGTEYGLRYYSIFLRAYADDEYSGSKSKEDLSVVNAFNINDFLTRAANYEFDALGGDYSALTASFAVRIYFVSAINNGKPEWRYVTEQMTVGAFVE